MASPSTTSAVNGAAGTASTPVANSGSAGDRRVRNIIFLQSFPTFFKQVLIEFVRGNNSNRYIKSSSGSNSRTLFSGLMTQKRSSGDAAAAARRQSWNEQKPAGGLLVYMWEKYVTCAWNSTSISRSQGFGGQTAD